MFSLKHEQKMSRDTLDYQPQMTTIQLEVLLNVADS